ncbi:MAG: ABC transporter permease [Alphaproteobacteria bacterium]|nr:ABC transporter permease [Alphaproteobacteria bacterium]MBL6938533.1 ABC transporter permease [Alphaproteobacteria bacterium]MBL7096592.1 ABC transporter permease [Alphaproteobacteria bacterium]
MTTADTTIGGGLTARLAHFYRRSEGARGLVLLTPTMLIMLAALAAPLALLALYSFWTQDGYVLDKTPTLAQYATGIGRATYRELFYRSVEISAVVTLITVLLAYPMAYFVAFRAEKKFIWLILLTIPFWTSYLLRVFTWKLILGYNGVINSGLMSLGIIHQPLELLLYNPTAVVVTLAHAWAAFAILPIYVSLEKIDRSLLEAAADLGDGPIRRFFRITLPLSMPGVIGAAVLIFVPTTGDYITPSLVGGSGGVMIANVIEEQFDKVGNWPLGAALAIASIAAVGIVTLLFVAAMRAAAARIR